ncbi:4-hydroxy-3-methylbut-2-enyl diphosphate reductase [Rickettsiales endosymbiont of Peranema trichophorum]|uniref:4-hydroxy-3-methylbut-2-enyl diphosphate reductase n=1 Tax=Rickettsiales endosymbiont of Peranema trichophorum TaxID=2486577 RepID=UPI00102367A7|nr:4-hydroxy-3-methylbut-2-enyl diphosphate reductase [Rickettsiales endosymbiont of Peranema trichophorum]RZI47454.1 4-hydroxy-3-methylbut-2-enyl diphosphate reductase [Rickettsiales endosymbiont of Peranema trichophorum]
MKKHLAIVLAQPRGFCAGVKRAIEAVEQAVKKYGTPIYVLHEIVHNRYVVDKLKNIGVRFVDTLQEVPRGSVVIFSAHGVATSVELEAQMLDLKVIDATCPLVKKVHHEVQRYEADGSKVILIGHSEHPEIKGTMGRLQSTPLIIETVEDIEKMELSNHIGKISYATQTTLSVDQTRGIVDALQQKFQDIQGQDVKDICYATQNRQDAVKLLAGQVDVLLVIGSHNSSNSNTLKELGKTMKVSSYLIDGAADLQQNWFDNTTRVGITAGASAPEVLVSEVVSMLSNWFEITVQEMEGIEETVRFHLPQELRS